MVSRAVETPVRASISTPVTPVQVLWVNMVVAVTLSLTLAFAALCAGLFYDASASQAASELVAGWSGVERSRLGRVVRGGTVIGEVADKLADELGLPRAVTIVAGGHDQCCNALGCGEYCWQPDRSTTSGFALHRVLNALVTRPATASEEGEVWDCLLLGALRIYSRRNGIGVSMAPVRILHEMTGKPIASGLPS